MFELIAWSIVVVIGVLGLWHLLVAFERFGHASLLKRPATPIAEAKPGPVKLAGKAKSGVPVTSPFTERTCIYTSTFAKQLGSETGFLFAVYLFLSTIIESIFAILTVVMMPSQQQGAKKRRQVELAADMTLTDPTGRMEVDLRGALFALEPREPIKIGQYDGDDLEPERLLKRLGIHHGMDRHFGWMLVEARLDQDQAVEVAGTLEKDQLGQLKLVDAVVISGQQPDQLIRRARREGIGRLLAALLFGAVVAWLTLGQFGP